MTLNELHTLVSKATMENPLCRAGWAFFMTHTHIELDYDNGYLSQIADSQEFIVAFAKHYNITK